LKEEHIVAEYEFNGVRVLVSDIAFAGKTEKELEDIRREARRIAWEIQLRHQARGESNT